MRILVVDDSVVMRSQIKLALSAVAGIKVVGSAPTGRLAFDRLEQWPIDLVIAPMHLADTPGLALVQGMRQRGLLQPVILCAEGPVAKAALTAIEAACADLVVLTPGLATDLQEVLHKHLLPLVRHYQHRLSPASNTTDVAPQSARPMTPWPGTLPLAIGIGSSTGGPAVLERIIAKLKDAPPRSLRAPIFIAQHMPPSFTRELATRLGELSGHPTKEADDGEVVMPGTIYIAPGDYHMTVRRQQPQTVTIHLDQGPKRNSVRPAVDCLFETLAQVYGAGCIAFVLTGMGEDGVAGAVAIKAAAGLIMIQDQASSIVWGMPGAVHAAGAFDAIGDIEQCGEALVRMLHPNTTGPTDAWGAGL